MKKSTRILAGLLILLAFVGSASAADKVWANTGTDYNTGASWTGGVLPGTGDSATFNTVVTNQPVLSAPIENVQLRFASPLAGGWTLSGSSALTLTSTGTGTAAGTGSAILSSNSSGTNTISAPIILGQGAGTTATFYQADGGTLAISGNISSANAITGLSLSAAGVGAKYIISGNNTYVGSTTISNALSLDIGSNTVFSSGAVTIASGNAVNVRAVGQDVALANTINGPAATAQLNLNVSGTQNLALNGLLNVSYGAILTNTIGTGKTLTLGDINIATGGALSTRSFIIAGTGNTAVTGTIADGNAIKAQNFSIQNSGTTTFSGIGNHTGATSFTAGTTNFSGTLNGTSGTTISGSAVFNETAAGSIQTGTFALTLGTATLAGANTYTGATTVTAGTLTLSGGGSLGGTAVTVATGATLASSGSYTIGTATAGSVSIAANGSILDLTNGSIGTLNFANKTAIGNALTIGGAAGITGILKFDVGATADQIALGTNARLNIGAAGGLVRITGLGNLDGTTQTLISSSTAKTGSGTLANLVLDATAGNFSGYTLALAASGNNLTLTEVANANAGAPVYWKGTNDGVWNTFSGGNTNTSNFATDAGGTNANFKIASTNDVVFNATSSGNITTTLGENYTVRSLVFNSNASGAVSIGGSNTLTIANAAGVNVATGSGNHTLSTKVALGADQTWTVTDAASTFAASNEISGGFALTKAGLGILALSGASTYGGATTVTAGTLVISGTGAINSTSGVAISGSSAKLKYDSSVAMSRSVTVTSGGTFAYNSSGNYTGTLTLTNGKLGGTNWNGAQLGGLTIGANQAISPGNSVGTATTTTQTWANSGSYVWEINKGDGIAGDVNGGWDLLTLSGALTISATSGTPFAINITSLGLDNQPGLATGFNSASSYSWLIADAGSAITTFSSDKFILNTTGTFQNSFSGTFAVALGNTGSIGGDNTQLYLTYTAVPEPSTWALLAFSLTTVVVLRRRRNS